MPPIDENPQTHPAPAGQGLAAPVATAPPDPEVEKLRGIASAFKEKGLSLESLDPELTKQAFESVAKFGKLDIPSQIEARASERAKVLLREYLESQKKEDPKDDEDEDDDVTEGNFQRKLLERLEALEKQRDSDKQESKRKLEGDQLKQMWGMEYVAAQEAYPWLRIPEVDQLTRLVATANLATTQDPMADRQGYVTNFVSQFADLIMKASDAIVSSREEHKAAQGGGTSLPKDFDFGEASDADFKEALASMMGVSR